jgi:hypothetical protein
MAGEEQVIVDVLGDPRTQHWDWVADYARARANSKCKKPSVNNEKKFA